jgi:hypothetical protein
MALAMLQTTTKSGAYTIQNDDNQALTSTLEVVHKIIVGLAVSRRGGEEDGTRGLHGALILKVERFCCFMSILMLNKDRLVVPGMVR